MAYDIIEAKDLVIKAGHALLENGLIARTWGNVSARISDTQFVITPSGLPYETLTREQVVVVNIADCEYEGNVKPSSEKGIHADAYRLRPDINFIIHTHQTAASVASISGRDLDDVPAEYAELIGGRVVTAEYGISSTKTLRENVATVYEANPEVKAFLMKHHGTVCLGKDYDEAFAVAEAIEKVAEAEITRACQYKAGNKEVTYADLADVFTANVVPEANRDIAPMDLGSSVKTAYGFVLTMADGTTYKCNEEGGTVVGPAAPRVSRIHAEIYKHSDVTVVRHFTAPETVAVSKDAFKTEPLYLDDYVQIAGFSVQNVELNKVNFREGCAAIGKAANGKNAIFVTGQGALVTANSDFDADAVELVLDKECKAHMYASMIPDAGTVGMLGGVLERTVYVLKYSKQADK